MTKNKSKPITLIVAAMLMGIMSFAQSIHFNYTGGTNASYNLEDVRKITFDADLMNLHLLDGSIYSWNVSTIGYYQYDEASLNLNEWISATNAWKVSVFPNPTSTDLRVRFNLPKEDEVSISLYDLKGKLILEKKMGNKISGEHQETLDLKNLPQGPYVCRITGKQNSITKQVIKQ
jgi:hypothetical protein